MNLFILIISLETYLTYSNLGVGILLLLLQSNYIITKNIPKRTLLHHIYFFLIGSYLFLTLITAIFLVQKFNFSDIIVLCLALFNIITFFIIKPKDIPKLNLKKPELKYFRKDGIKIGSIFHENNVLKRFKINIEDIKRHVIIYGQTGTGKTWFLRNFLFQFSKKYPDIHFILFEFKGEYLDLHKYIPSVNVIHPGENFKINLFDNDIFPDDIYVEILFDSLKSCQIIEANADFSPQMEKVLIDVLKEVCDNKKSQSWEKLFEIIDRYAIENGRIIPLIHQTTISIKNRLRRYASGSLASLFDFKGQANRISELLSKNCIIDLGHILKLGGSKEDVIFFANLILKWIWEFNIKKEPSKNLNHLTIFEDASYIASKKLLDSSQLSTYLEDIALLLRGKGEALISLTTTLDISKNIIMNSGTKFFFKFNEKPEDVIHYLGINSKDQIDINELKIGYCLAKIDSIPEVFLFKAKTLKKYQKIGRNCENRGGPTTEKINGEVKTFSDEMNQKKKIGIKNRQELIKKAEDLFLINNYNQSLDILTFVIKDIEENFDEIIISDKERKIFCEINKFVCKTLPEQQKNEHFGADQILNILTFIKKINQRPWIKKQEKAKSYDPSFQKLTKNKSNGKKKVEKKRNPLQSKFGITLYYFNMITGPEKYFEIGGFHLPKHVEQRIAKNMDVNCGEICLEIESFFFYTQIFEIDSLWARGKHEIVQLVICSRVSDFDRNLMLPQLKNTAQHMINLLKMRKRLFHAFYLTNSAKKVKMAEEIKNESIFLKKEIKKLYNQLRKGEIFKKGEMAFDLIPISESNNEYDLINSIIESLLTGSVYEKKL